jgi:hypothetical protein
VQPKFQTHKENWPNLIFEIAHTLSIFGRFLMPGPLIDWLRITISYLNPHRSFPSHRLASKPFLSRRRRKTLDCFIPSGTYSADRKRRHLPLQPCAHSLSSIMPWSLAAFLVHPNLFLFDLGMNNSHPRFSTSALRRLISILGITITIVFSVSTIRDMSSSSIEYSMGSNTQIWEENKHVRNIYAFHRNIPSLNPCSHSIVA